MALFKNKLSSDWYFPILITITIVAGIWGAGFAAVTVDRSTKNSLQQRASSIALALDTQKLVALSGSTDDLQSPAYQELKDRLSTLKQINYDTRFIYLVGLRDNKLYYLVDSEHPDTADYAAPGEAFDERTPRMRNSFETREPFIVGPVSDTRGTWFTAVAPVVDPSTNQVVAAVGLDVPARDHYIAIASYAAVALSICFAISILAYAGNVIYKRERQLLTLRSEYVSVTSHDLLSPLSGIRWAAEAMLNMDRTNLTILQLRHIVSIHESAELLIETANDLLNISSIESGHDQLNFKQLNLTRVVRGIFSNLKLAAQSRGVELMLDPSWPEELIVWGDEDKLKRAFGNLISNAIKYTRSDTKVELSYKKVDGHHQMDLRDQGIGIPKAEQSKVFKGFYRAQNAVGTSARGTGMGLYLSRKLIELHHGKLSFESVENVGTTFHVILPDKHRKTPPPADGKPL